MNYSKILQYDFWYSEYFLKKDPKSLNIVYEREICSKNPKINYFLLFDSKNQLKSCISLDRVVRNGAADSLFKSYRILHNQWVLTSISKRQNIATKIVSVTNDCVGKLETNTELNKNHHRLYFATDFNKYF